MAKKKKDLSKSGKTELTEEQLKEATGGAASSTKSGPTRVSDLKDKATLPTRDVLSSKW